MIDEEVFKEEVDQSIKKNQQNNLNSFITPIKKIEITKNDTSE